MEVCTDHRPYPPFYLHNPKWWDYLYLNEGLAFFSSVYVSISYLSRIRKSSMIPAHRVFIPLNDFGHIQMGEAIVLSEFFSIG
jgi:hypothetical protein